MRYLKGYFVYLFHRKDALYISYIWILMWIMALSIKFSSSINIWMLLCFTIVICGAILLLLLELFEKKDKIRYSTSGYTLPLELLDKVCLIMLIGLTLVFLFLTVKYLKVSVGPFFTFQLLYIAYMESMYYNYISNEFLQYQNKISMFKKIVLSTGMIYLTAPLFASLMVYVVFTLFLD